MKSAKGKAETFSDSKMAGGADSCRIQHVLLATDFSNLSRHAFHLAVRLAQTFAAKISLLHVFPEILPADLSHLGIVFEQKQAAQRAQEELRVLRTREFPPDLLIEPVLLQGGPAHEIVEFAKKSGADLIVMATHGYTGLKHAWLGSTAENVLRRAPCPVLIVPANSAERFDSRESGAPARS